MLIYRYCLNISQSVAVCMAVWPVFLITFSLCGCKRDECAKQSLPSLHMYFRCLFLPCFFPPCLSIIWLSPNPLFSTYLLSVSLNLSCCLSLTPLISSSPTPLVFASMPPPPAYFSVDGDLSRPWLTLAQPPPPLCSLWWWGSLCCDTEAGSADRAADWNTDSPELQTLGKDRGQTDW